MTQREAVLNHLKSHKTITSMEAIQLYGVTRLSAVIKTLRTAGHRINTLPATTVNRYGHTTNYGVYVLLKDAETARKEEKSA